MDAITNALKTLNNSGNNIKKDFFHEESFIYMKTNEMIQEYVQYLLHKKNILSVIGSGDQIINSLIKQRTLNQPYLQQIILNFSFLLDL